MELDRFLVEWVAEPVVAEEPDDGAEFLVGEGALHLVEDGPEDL